jgi:low affinity Fe/Cu permease
MVHHIVQQPLTSSFMLVAMLGFLVSWFLVFPFSETWGFTFMLTFGIFFIASVYNFTHAPDEDDLAVHEPHRHLKHLKAYQR